MRRQTHVIASFICWILILTIFGGCEETFIPETNGNVNQIVVEGYVEASDRNIPPYVILTRSQPFFNSFDQDDLENLFIHDAVVEVKTQNQSYLLTELCLEELEEPFKSVAAEFLGFNADTIGFNFCAYLDLAQQIPISIGERYDLLVMVEETQISATTTIPPAVPLDSIWFVQTPGEPNDTLAQMRCSITDPVPEKNFYRYFTKINDEPFQSPFTSVTNDELFEGQSFEFPLPKAESVNDDFDPETFGFYRIGDQVTLKWVTIDESHFNFWNTWEFNAVNQGPFSNYTQVDSNIEGGLGIWGGLSANYYERTVIY